MTLTTRRTGIRPYVRALALSQGYHMDGTRSANDGDEQLVMQAQHDQVSDAYHKQADDELDFAEQATDPRTKNGHIRASRNYRAEAYRFEAYEDDRRALAQAALIEAREAGVAGSQTCDQVLRLKPACKHGKAA